MRILNLFRRNGSAPVARERLQILLSHERAEVGQPSMLVIELREEILAVVARHFPIDPDQVSVRMERGQSLSLFEIEIEIPHPARRGALAA